MLIKLLLFLQKLFNWERATVRSYIGRSYIDKAKMSQCNLLCGYKQNLSMMPIL